MYNHTVIPTIQIRNNSIICYNLPTISKRKQANNILENGLMATKDGTITRTAYSGEITKGMIKRLRKAIELLIASTPIVRVEKYDKTKFINHRLSFITLTIPDNIKLTAKETNKLLIEPLLLILRRKHQLRSYVWKCEKQERGQLHYHITSNVYIAYTDLNDIWNALLTKNGYNDEYYKKHKHRNANSTDIHSVRNIKNLDAYLIKYFIKSYQNEGSIQGKVWDCSSNLKTAKYTTVVGVNELDKVLSMLEADGELNILETDNCTIVKSRKRHIYSYLTPSMQKAHTDNMRSVWEWKRANSTPTQIHAMAKQPSKPLSLFGHRPALC